MIRHRAGHRFARPLNANIILQEEYLRLGTKERWSLGVALNEAAFLGCELDTARRIIVTTFRVLTLPEKGDPPDDTRVQIVFMPVGRVAASLRLGAWDDEVAEVQPITTSELLPTVQSFGGLPIYGWDFFDRHGEELQKWGSRLSLDWQSGENGLEHSAVFFQEAVGRHLDLCIWFDELHIRTPDGSAISIEDFCAGGKRWWDAMYAGAPRTGGGRIEPLRGS